ncbi:MAG: HEAT repeat domain-containing protein [Treponemataceae bacterium]|nr:MAG: HEAT repeat domain-containing protein [Treponemataceae bacterium]
MKKFLAVFLLGCALCAAEDAKDKTQDQKDRETLLYGLDTEIITLLDTLKKEERISYRDEVLRVFSGAKTAALKESVINYAAAFQDDCLKDEALAAAEDPFDERASTVSLWLRYIGAIKMTAAAPALRKLLDGETPEYFDAAVTALGEIGNTDDAEFLLDYMENNSLSAQQRQTLMKSLVKLNDSAIAPRLVAIAEDSDENIHVRMYAAEAAGASGNDEYVANLIALYDNTDPNFRVSVVKALAGFAQNRDASALIIQAIRDNYYKVRIEAIGAAKKLKLNDAEPYLLSRAANDPESVVKYEAYNALAALGTGGANDFLTGIIADKKMSETSRAKAAAALLENGGAGLSQIIALAEETLKDDKQKNLRYALGKEFAKYDNAALAGICGEYLAHTDAATKGTGLDIYAKGRYASAAGSVRQIAEDPKGGAVAAKAQRILAQN